MRGAARRRGLLRERDFRRLYLVRVVSQAADGMFQASLGAAVLFNPEHQTDAGRAAAGFAVVLLPYSLLGPFAGVLIDRWRRQRVLGYGNVVRAGLAAAVATVLVTHGPGGPLFYLAALGVLSVNRFSLAALSAALPHVVDEERLVTANSLSTTSGSFATFVGAGLAVSIRAVADSDDHGSALIALAAGCVYLASSALAARIPVDLLGPDDDRDRPATVDAVRTVARGFVEGARHVAHRPHTARALAAISAHRFFYGLSFLATILLYRNYFTDHGPLRAGLTGLAQAVAATVAGMLLAAAATPWVTRRIGKSRWLLVLVATASVVQVALGLPFETGPLLAAAFVLGVVAQGGKIAVDTIVQESVEDAYRGRVFSLYDMLFNLPFVASVVLGAFVLPPTGRSYLALFLVAGGYGLTALLYGVALARERRLTAAPAAPAVARGRSPAPT